MGKSAIPYIDWGVNFITGCTKASDGCENCYAKGMYNHFDKSNLPFETVRVDMPLLYKRLDEIDGKKPMVIGVNFMADTFHECVKDTELDDLFNHLGNYPEHQFLIFTKRYQRLATYIDNNLLDIPKNVHLGVSICNNKDLYKFLDIAQNSKWDQYVISIEPLLEMLDSGELGRLVNYFSKWVIVGAESGPKKRGYSETWAIDILNWCDHYSIPFYHKQQFIKNKKTNILDGRTFLINPLEDILRGENEDA